MRTLSLILAASTMVGCVSTSTLTPIASLTEVTRPASARERYGEQVISRTTTDSGVTKYSFEDQMIKGLFFVGQSGVHFDLTNKTEYSMRLVWDEVTLVLPEGDPSPVMHYGTKYTDCSSSKPASVLPRGATVTDVAIPCKRVRFGYQSWVEGDLFPGFQRSVVEPVPDSLISRLASLAKGKRVSLLLPLQIEGVTNEYTFSFFVDSVHVVRPTKP